MGHSCKLFLLVAVVGCGSQAPKFTLPDPADLAPVMELVCLEAGETSEACGALALAYQETVRAVSDARDAVERYESGELPLTEAASAVDRATMAAKHYRKLAREHSK